MAKSVVDGKLIQLSPSSINAFDDTTPFGCERRWHFKYVQGLEEPSTAGQNLGTDTHAINEMHLVHGPARVTAAGASSFNPDAYGLYLRGFSYLEAIRPRLLSSEQQMNGEILGIPVLGYIDALLDAPPEVVDFKTSKDIRRYGKTEEELKTDTQMILYGRFGHPNADEVKLTHAQYQTDGSAFRVVTATVSRNHIDSVLGERILPLVSRMVVAAKSELLALPRTADEGKCRRCPFRINCPTAQGVALMSFLNRFATNTTATPTPAASVIAPAPVVPADAPVSQPALAADSVTLKEGDPGFIGPVSEPQAQAAAPTPPVADSAPAPAPARRGPGRPPGSKNKPKLLHVPDEVPAAAPPVPAAPLTLTKISMSQGLTIPDVMGKFSGARVDVSVEGIVGVGGADAAWEALSKEVQKRLEAEAKPYLELAAAASAKGGK